jgi:ribosomal protein S18 acetylase RimI-like enzyme
MPPSIIYICKNKSQVTKKEKIKLLELTYPDGLLRSKFRNNHGFVIIAKIQNKIIGWAFVFQNNNKDKDGNKCKTFYVFVSPEYRKMGIGSQLYFTAIHKYKFLYVSRHNKTSTKFFNKVELKYKK